MGSSLVPPVTSTSEFGFSVASTSTASVIAVVGLEQDNRDFSISLYHKTEKTNKAATTSSGWKLDTGAHMNTTGRHVLSSYGWDMQIAQETTRTSGDTQFGGVHVIASGDRVDSSDEAKNEVFMDAFYCSDPQRSKGHGSGDSLTCQRSRFVFDERFHNEPKVFPGQMESFETPPPISTMANTAESDNSKDQAGGLYETSLYSSMYFPLPFSLSSNGRFMALGYLSSLAIQEWQPPQLSNNFEGAWMPTFGTKRIGLDDQGMAATLLYVAMSNEGARIHQEESHATQKSKALGAEGQDEVIMAAGMIRSDMNDQNGYVIAVPQRSPRNPVEGPLEVVVYKWNKHNGQSSDDSDAVAPKVMGTPIRSQGHLTRGLDLPFPRNSVQISECGKVLAVLSLFRSTGDDRGSNDDDEDMEAETWPMIKVFEWNDVADDWKLRQTFVLEDNALVLAASYSLSANGSVLAISDASRVLVYQWNVQDSRYLSRSVQPQEVPQRSGRNAATTSSSTTTSTATSTEDSLRMVHVSGDASTLLLGSPFATTDTGGLVETFQIDV